MNKIFLDLETTGFSRQWDYIIEIAAILCDDNYNAIDSFHEYIKPNKRIPDKIVELTGISNEDVCFCRDERTVLMDFNEWAALSDSGVIVAHNGKAFDLDFIQKKNDYYKYSNNWISKNRLDGTLSIARQLAKQGKISVENFQQPTLAKYFNIQYDAHSAIEDVKALIEIYKNFNNLNKPITRDKLGF